MFHVVMQYPITICEKAIRSALSTLTSADRLMEVCQLEHGPPDGWFRGARDLSSHSLFIESTPRPATPAPLASLSMTGGGFNPAAMGYVTGNLGYAHPVDESRLALERAQALLQIFLTGTFAAL